MLRRLFIVAALLAVGLGASAGQADAASGQVALPMPHLLRGILVDLYRPNFLFGYKNLCRGFVATDDGLVLAPLGGLEDVRNGDELKLEWTDKRTAEGWLVWKDREMGLAIVRLLEPMPLFPSVGWRQDEGPKPGEALFTPGPPSGGQPTVLRAAVAARRDVALPSGRQLARAIIVAPALGAGPPRGPLLDEAGNLVGVVSALEPPPGSPPGTVVGAPIAALGPDLVAARGMRPPRPVSRPTVAPRPTYRIGIGIGSGGIRPSIGFGMGLGGLSSRRGLRDRSFDPHLRHEQESLDRAKTEALERSLEKRAGMKPVGPVQELTNSEPLPKGGPAPSAGEGWQAGAASVTSANGPGKVREMSPEAFRHQRPSIGTTWNPAGPPLGGTASSTPAGKWPVVVEPKAPSSLRDEQRETDRAKTEALERELAGRGVEGSLPSAPSGEIMVVTSRPAAEPQSASKRRSLEELEAELDAVRARRAALERELEEMRRGAAGSR